MKANVRVAIFGMAVFVMVVQMPLLGGCGKGGVPTPVVCATYQAADGTWMEEDGEPVDADPCDLDDAFEIEHPKTPKPLVKKSPAAAQSTLPLGGRRKKF
jgi:hypothetical protein